jgi:putative N6-adenine-specific DNA methylase
MLTERSPILVSCAKGVAPLLASELRAMGSPVLGETGAGVETEGTLADAMRLNLHLRTAQRVLVQIADLRVRTPDELYLRFNRLPWERWLHADGYLRVASTVHSDTIRDPRFATLKAKDGIVDHMRKATGRRPDTGPSRDRAVVFFYWNRDVCRVYLDTSGESLSRRGYRVVTTAAPMQESLAAAVVLATGWTGDAPFLNPMCGSGTLAIEAACFATNRPPSLLRENFGFMHIKGYDAQAWAAIKGDAASRVRPLPPGAAIVASDHDPKAVAAAQRNARAAGVADVVSFHVCDFADTPVPPGGGVVVVNPEYGERMGDAAQLAPTYERIGDFFKQRCQGYTGYLFSGNLDLAKKQGLRPSRRWTFYNGDIECRLLAYTIYAGTRRRSKLAAQSLQETPALNVRSGEG